jgi:sigma-B regulation protein RsbU (phosphoserine phosphatase)
MSITIQKDSPLILVADDDRFTRMLLRQILEQDGYRVQEVVDGEQCLAAYERERPDMVLLDAVMPMMDGFTCCTQLQVFNAGELPLNGDSDAFLENAVRTPVLMITGLNDQDSVDRAFAAGAIDYVTKPIHPPVLRQRLRRLLEASWAEKALRESEKKYRSAVDNLREVIFQADMNRRLMFLNPAWTEITGFSLGESIGKCFIDFMHPDDHDIHTRHIQALLKRQQEECRYQIRYLPKKGGVVLVEIYASLLCADDGTPIGLSGTLNDITDRKRREQHLSAEHATTRVLAESVNLAEATPKLLQAICKSLGWDLGELWSVDAKANVLRCVQTWHLPTLLETCNRKSLEEFQAITEQITFAPGVGLPGSIWASGEPIWIADVVKDANFPRARVAANVGLHAAFGLPILTGDERLGVLTFFSQEIQPPDMDLLKVMRAIGGQIGQFIKRKQAEEELQRQNAILQGELNQAAVYVRSLLPRRLTGTVSIEQQFVPSLQLGGDAFDYRWLDDEHLVVYLLDVAGHGVKSALLSVSVLNVLRSQSLPNTNFAQPSAVLTALNQVFQMGETGDDYFTIWYGVYHKSKRQLVYACAGHPPAILIFDTATNTSVKQLGVPGLPIGMLPEADFEEQFYEIPPNSTLYIFSDGVYELHQPDDKIWGLNNFVNLLTAYQKSNTQKLDNVLHQIQDLNANQVLDDDFSLLQIQLC